LSTRPPRRLTAVDRLGRFVRPYKALVAAALAYEVLSVGVQLVLPWPMKLVVDHVLGDASLPGWLHWLGAVGPVGLALVAAGTGTLLSLLDSLMTYAASIASVSAGEFVARDIRAEMMRHLLALGPEFHEGFETGEIASRLSSDVDRVQSNMVLLATGVLPDIVLLLGMLMVVAMIDSRLALVVVVVVPPLLMLTRLRRRLTRDAQTKVRQAGGRLEAATIEHLRHLRLAQMFTQEHHVRGQYSIVNEGLVTAELDGNRIDARFRPPTDLIMSIGAMVVIVFGVTQIRAGRLTTGTLLVVLSYLGSVYGPIRRLAGISAATARASISADRIAAILDARPIVQQGPIAMPPRFTRAIRFDRVEARYPNGFPALSDISLTITPGQRVCIVGKTGAGKSTLLSLIPRMIDPSSGTISVDDVHLGAFDLGAWRHLVATVPQEPQLFRASIHDNIAFGRVGVTRAEVIEAATLAYVDEFVTGMADGYDTIVGADGSRLSGGQRRRVALARALVRRAPILLLDEPTTGLDPQSEKIVIAAIGRAAVGRTCITVTHRADLAMESDCILVLEGGRLIESGRPRDLLRAGGPFAEMRATEIGTRIREIVQR
jgi:ATP-binding cassette, subfamily B, bacterial